jgi:tetrapyrrole methylase family protein/MazG family protein
MSASGFSFRVVPAKGEELIPPNTPSEQAAAALAQQKAEEVHALFPDCVVVAADTIVVIDGDILNKPIDKADAFSMLKRLSGRRHNVFTGVAIYGDISKNIFCEKTEVEFHELSDEEINAYIETGEPFDKAGAYGIQEKGMLLVKEIKGDFYNVMGLPISRVSRELQNQHGISPGSGKKSYDIHDLRGIMARLRTDCPWDREQTHASIRTNVIEEAYEVAEAIDSGVPELLCEELGDLLLQVVFHAQIASETQRFGFEDICVSICEKLIYRHPHVFGDTKADSADEVLKNWDELKAHSKRMPTAANNLDDVPKSLPALMRGEKVGKRAANAGFDFANVNETLDCLKSEINELESAINSNLVELHKKESQIEEEFGDVLFSCCNLGRFLKKDCEKALTFSVNRFIMRFRRLEDMLFEMGKKFEELSQEQLNELWQSSKKHVASSQ